MERAAGGLDLKERTELVRLLKKLGRDAQAQLDAEENERQSEE
jgi:hypothetical protein